MCRTIVLVLWLLSAAAGTLAAQAGSAKPGARTLMAKGLVPEAPSRENPSVWALPVGVSGTVGSRSADEFARGLRLGSPSDSAKPDRTLHTVVGGVVGALVGYTAGVLYDRHLSNQGRTGSNPDHITYIVGEVLLTPIGALVGALIGRHL